jgi:hypothetical protein
MGVTASVLLWAGHFTGIIKSLSLWQARAGGFCAPRHGLLHNSITGENLQSSDSFLQNSRAGQAWHPSKGLLQKSSAGEVIEERKGLLQTSKAGDAWLCRRGLLRRVGKEMTLSMSGVFGAMLH